MAKKQVPFEDPRIGPFLIPEWTTAHGKKAVDVPPIIFLDPEEPAEISDEEFNSYVDQYNQEIVNLDNLKYLQDTDWYATREREAGTPIPEDVRLKRQEAREAMVRTCYSKRW